MHEPRERPLVLIGLRGTGKSTAGRLLAESLGRPFVDLDDEIAELASRGEVAYATAGEVLAALGEASFRRIEHDALARAVARADGPVVAAGGGAVVDARTRALLARRATCVWLRAPVVVLRARLAAGPALRPPILGRDALEELAELERRRAPLYAEVADHEVDASASPEEIARAIARLAGRAEA